MEVHTRRIRRKERQGNHQPSESNGVLVMRRPLEIDTSHTRCRGHKRRAELVHQEQRRHRQQEDVAGHVVAPPEARHCAPVCAGEDDGGGEEGRMRARADGGPGVAEIGGDADDGAVRQVDDALASGADDEALEHGGAEEPAREAEEDGGRGGVLREPPERARCGRGGEEEREECGGRPAPDALDEEDVEHVLLVGEVVRRVEGVRERGEEGVGGVEVGGVDYG